MTIIPFDQLPNDDSLHKVEEATITIKGIAQKIDIWKSTFMGRTITYLVEHVEDTKISKQIKRNLDCIQHDGETLKKRRVVVQNPTTPPTTINDLPPEVLQMIFFETIIGSNYKGLIATLRQTCGSFKQAANDYILGIYLKERNLSFKDIGLTTKDAAVEFAIKMGKNLRIADFTPFNLTNDDLEILSNNCPNIEILDLHVSINVVGYNDWEPIHEATGSEDISDYGLQFLDKMARLKSLNISRCGFISGEGLKHLSKMVESLYISGCNVSSEEDIITLSKFKELRKLDLSEQECDLDRRSYRHLKNLVRLEELDISIEPDYGCELFPDDFSFIENLKFLRKLSMPMISDLSWFKYVSNLPNLEELSVILDSDDSIDEIEVKISPELLPPSIRTLHLIAHKNKIKDILSSSYLTQEIFMEHQNLHKVVVNHEYEHVRTNRPVIERNYERVRISHFEHSYKTF